MFTTAIIAYLSLFHFAKFTSGSEPACSPYHYEEQTLEKMIRQEVVVERMKSDMEDTKRKVQETLIDIDKEMNKVAMDLEEKTKSFEEMKSGIDKAIADVKARTDERIASYSAEMEKMKATTVTPFVAFNAHEATEKSISNHKVIIFTENRLNQGGAYNNKTGIFVAPVGGVYLLTVQICIGANDWAYFGIFIGERIVSGQGIGDSYFKTCSSVDTIALVKQGEQVTVKCAASCASSYRLWENGNYATNNFSGFLLHRTSE